MALIDPESLAARLQQDLDTASAELAIETATALVEAVTGPVASRTSTVLLPIRGGQYVDLPSAVITAVATVLVDGNAATWEWLKPYPLVLLKTWTLSSAVEWHTATVTYTHGHPIVPKLIRAVALEVAARAYSPAPAPGVSVQIDDYRESSSAGTDTTGVMLTAHERRALESLSATTAFAL